MEIFRTLHNPIPQILLRGSSKLLFSCGAMAVMAEPVEKPGTETGHDNSHMCHVRIIDSIFYQYLEFW
jgi:hypothetical protein